VHVLPCLATIVGDIESAVVAEQDVFAVSRIDPDRMVIAVRNAWHGVPRFSAIHAFEERRAALIRNLRIGGIDADLAVVHPPIALVRQEPPALSSIVGSP